MLERCPGIDMIPIFIVLTASTDFAMSARSFVQPERDALLEGAHWPSSAPRHYHGSAGMKDTPASTGAETKLPAPAINAVGRCVRALNAFRHPRGDRRTSYVGGRTDSFFFRRRRRGRAVLLAVVGDAHLTGVLTQAHGRENQHAEHDKPEHEPYQSGFRHEDSSL